MRLQVLLFASYADALGRSEIAVELPEGATVAALVSAVRAMAPNSPLPLQPLVAVNQAYAGAGDLLRAGDEIALIPPVAGG